MLKIELLTNAISNLTPAGSEWSVKGINIPDDILCKNEADMPTKVDIEAEMDRLEKEFDSQEYARNRASAFPSIGDQLDMQYWDQVNGTTTWEDAIAKVKLDNPKE